MYKSALLLLLLLLKQHLFVIAVYFFRSNVNFLCSSNEQLFILMMLVEWCNYVCCKLVC